MVTNLNKQEVVILDITHLTDLAIWNFDIMICSVNIERSSHLQNKRSE